MTNSNSQDGLTYSEASRIASMAKVPLSWMDVAPPGLDSTAEGDREVFARRLAAQDDYAQIVALSAMYRCEMESAYAN